MKNRFNLGTFLFGILAIQPAWSAGGPSTVIVTHQIVCADGISKIEEIRVTPERALLAKFIGTHLTFLSTEELETQVLSKFEGEIDFASTLTALVYFDRYQLSTRNLGTRNECDGTFNAKEQLIISFIVALKVLDDHSYWNVDHSDPLGISVSKLNALEAEFLRGLDYNVSLPLPSLEPYLRTYGQIASDNPCFANPECKINLIEQVL